MLSVFPIDFSIQSTLKVKKVLTTPPKKTQLQSYKAMMPSELSGHEGYTVLDFTFFMNSHHMCIFVYKVQYMARIHVFYLQN